jgi:hypothetical protein
MKTFLKLVSNVLRSLVELRAKRLLGRTGRGISSETLMEELERRAPTRDDPDYEQHMARVRERWARHGITREDFL